MCLITKRYNTYIMSTEIDNGTDTGADKPQPEIGETNNHVEQNVNEDISKVSEASKDKHEKPKDFEELPVKTENDGTDNSRISLFIKKMVGDEIDKEIKSDKNTEDEDEASENKNFQIVPYSKEFDKNLPNETGEDGDNTKEMMTQINDKEENNNGQGIKNGQNPEYEENEPCDEDTKGLTVFPGDVLYPASYAIQDDVNFLKFYSSFNDQVCTCDSSSDKFALEDINTTNYHREGCPSSLTLKDIESIKVIYLTRHQPVCKRFLTQNEQGVLKKVLKTAPYYQVEFYNRQYPYKIRIDGGHLIKNHMTEDRKFPMKDNIKDIETNKKIILTNLKNCVEFGDPKIQTNGGDEVDINGVVNGCSPNKRAVESSKNNLELSEERLILNLLNDNEAWTCFTSICLCEVISAYDKDEIEGPSPSDNEIKSTLMEGIPPRQMKAVSCQIDQHLEYFDRLIKERLREKIHNEREYLEILIDGKLKKEKLFIEILSYKYKTCGKNKNEMCILVNEMFRELIRNNKDIGRNTEDKLNTENCFMQRDIQNKVKLKLCEDLKLDASKKAHLENHIQNVLQDKFNKEYDLIKTELEYLLERCNEKSLHFFQSMLNEVTQSRFHEYDNINEYFRELFPISENCDKPTSKESGRIRVLTEPQTLPSLINPESCSSRSCQTSKGRSFYESKTYARGPTNTKESNKNKPYSYVLPYDRRTITSLDSLEKKEERTNFSYVDIEKVAKSTGDFNEMGSTETYFFNKSMTLRRCDNIEDVKNICDAHTQTRPLKNKPFTLREDIDKIMTDLWSSSEDKQELIRQLVNEMKRYDLFEQFPLEKNLLTKKKHIDFKNEIDFKLTPKLDEKPSKTVKYIQKTKPDKEAVRDSFENNKIESDKSEPIVTMQDEDFKYLILDLPMTDHQKLELFHDSFYGRRKTTAEIHINSELNEIRTDIVMKNEKYF